MVLSTIATQGTFSSWHSKIWEGCLAHDQLGKNQVWEPRVCLSPAFQHPLPRGVPCLFHSLSSIPGLIWIQVFELYSSFKCADSGCSRADTGTGGALEGSEMACGDGEGAGSLPRNLGPNDGSFTFPDKFKQNQNLFLCSCVICLVG